VGCEAVWLGSYQHFGDGTASQHKKTTTEIPLLLPVIRVAFTSMNVGLVSVEPIPDVSVTAFVSSTKDTTDKGEHNSEKLGIH
jgi:hypothetical protein